METIGRSEVSFLAGAVAGAFAHGRLVAVASLPALKLLPSTLLLRVQGVFLTTHRTIQMHIFG